MTLESDRAEVSTAIVILNWRGADDTVACLDSFGPNPEATLIVVDNGSHDGSVERIRAAHPEVTLLETGENLGFSAGNNRGLRWALDRGFDVVAILNNDTLVTPGFTTPLVDVVLTDPAHAYVSPRITYADDPSSTWFADVRRDPRRGVLVHVDRPPAPDAGPHPVEMVTGCALFAHRDLWIRVGLLAESYFLIFEDAEWSLRANRQGCQGYVDDRSVIQHRVSSTISASANFDSTYYYARNGTRLLLDSDARSTVPSFIVDVLRHTVRDTDQSLGDRGRRVGLATRGFVDGVRRRDGKLPTAQPPGPVPPVRARDRSQPPEEAVSDLRARTLAFYLPQFHPIPENDEWWGAGFTEWTNTAKARPRFPGHYQPHIPGDLGFYDLRLPDARQAQAELAHAYGVEGFLYWHYWFGAGRRILERPFAEVLESGEPDFPFALAWANQTWSGIWHGLPDHILLEQQYLGVDDDRAHFELLLDAFTDDRYITVDGKPLFYVFRPEQLPEPAEFVDRWQGMAQEAGLPGLYLVAEISDLWGRGPTYPDPFSPGFDAGVMVRLPIDAALELSVPQKVARRAGFPEVHRYADQPAAYPACDPDAPVFPCVYPNWDNTPRSGRRGLVAHGSTPTKWRTHVEEGIERTRNLPTEERFLFVKSWNEWAEGNHLEPDLRFGHAYLEELARALRR